MSEPFFERELGQYWNDGSWLPIGFARLKCSSCNAMRVFRVYRNANGKKFMMGCMVCGKRRYSSKLPRTFSKT